MKARKGFRAAIERAAIGGFAKKENAQKSPITGHIILFLGEWLANLDYFFSYFLSFRTAMLLGLTIWRHSSLHVASDAHLGKGRIFSGGWGISSSMHGKYVQASLHQKFWWGILGRKKFFPQFSSKNGVFSSLCREKKMKKKLEFPFWYRKVSTKVSNTTVFVKKGKCLVDIYLPDSDGDTRRLYIFFRVQPLFAHVFLTWSCNWEGRHRKQLFRRLQTLSWEGRSGRGEGSLTFCLCNFEASCYSCM